MKMLIKDAGVVAAAGGRWHPPSHHIEFCASEPAIWRKSDRATAISPDSELAASVPGRQLASEEASGGVGS